jgi:hypothetical protein
MKTRKTTAANMKMLAAKGESETPVTPIAGRNPRPQEAHPEKTVPGRDKKPETKLSVKHSVAVTKHEARKDIATVSNKPVIPEETSILDMLICRTKKMFKYVLDRADAAKDGWDTSTAAVKNNVENNRVRESLLWVETTDLKKRGALQTSRISDEALILMQPSGMQTQSF